MTLRNGLVNLANAEGCSHAGLALDKYLKGHDDKGEEKKALIRNVVTIPVPPVYKNAYNFWEKKITTDSNNKYGKFRVVDRLIVGLGGSGVLETGITLHHTYGVPYIPGSALKGLARHYLLHNTEGEEKENYAKVLFGDTDSGGYITFFDAFFVPANNNSNPLHHDIITTHHQNYYTANSAAWPTDFDDPIPVSFISATGSFLIAINGPSAEWNNFAFELLTKALQDYGIGGKTSSGYGRLVPEGGNVPPPPPPPGTNKIIDDMKNTKSKDFKGTTDGFILKILKISNEEDKKNTATVLLKRLQKENITRDTKGIQQIKIFFEYIDKNQIS